MYTSLRVLRSNTHLLCPSFASHSVNPIGQLSQLCKEEGLSRHLEKLFATMQSRFRQTFLTYPRSHLVEPASQLDEEEHLLRLLSRLACQMEGQQERSGREGTWDGGSDLKDRSDLNPSWDNVSLGMEQT